MQILSYLSTQGVCLPVCSIQYVNGVPSFTAKNLKAIPLFSEFDDEDEQESTVSVRAITPTVFLGLKLKELIKFIKEVPDFRDTFEKAVDKQLRLCISYRCPLYVRYMSGTCPVHVRFYIVHLPYIYRTSTGHELEILPCYMLVPLGLYY